MSLRLRHLKSSFLPRAPHRRSNLKLRKLFHTQSIERERLRASKISHIGSNPRRRQKSLLSYTQSTRRYPLNSSKPSGDARINPPCFCYSFSSCYSSSSSSSSSRLLQLLSKTPDASPSLKLSPISTAGSAAAISPPISTRTSLALSSPRRS